MKNFLVFAFIFFSMIILSVSCRKAGTLPQTQNTGDGGAAVDAAPTESAAENYVANDYADPDGDETDDHIEAEFNEQNAAEQNDSEPDANA
ncbi:MAG: hypothetical protein FWF03_07680, partial [Defluviitaleaceae bacterium]|nr:hypothetical protein [Defluviitaleaceae bacterium]